MPIEIVYYDRITGQKYEVTMKDEIDTYIYLRKLECDETITNLKYRRVEGWLKLK